LYASIHLPNIKPNSRIKAPNLLKVRAYRSRHLFISRAVKRGGPMVRLRGVAGSIRLLLTVLPGCASVALVALFLVHPPLGTSHGWSVTQHLRACLCIRTMDPGLTASPNGSF